ncbi:MAG: ArsJ-associated glyceraldehyde-3-phosphate dehydrogenase [Hyphomicrobiaceae bacterium]|nr:ArsJ-associated glyceraldehyde-3-phosphate dehydrogenase [Hyphomicrobiaceae bacterium]
MTARVAINGFGRMGRLALRAAWGFHAGADEVPGPGGLWGAGAFDIVHVNEPNADAALSAHLLAFDSVQGRWRVPTKGAGETLSVGDKSLTYSQASSPTDVDWRNKGIDIVIECSGKFKTKDALRPYFDAGVKKVVVSAPVKQDGVLDAVVGVNDHLYDPRTHDIVTAASCTTNCLAPVVKVIHEALGIRHGVITTIHDVTNTQTVVDRPHKDYRRARSALLNLVPTSTGSATAIGVIFPELLGKLNGVAVRVPLLNASITDCVFEVEHETTVEEVNDCLKDAADGPLKGILAYEERPLVSTDFIGDPHSSIIDARSTMVVDGTQVKVLAWYDNEVGYVHRMVELTQTVARGLGAGRKAAE